MITSLSERLHHTVRLPTNVMIPPRPTIQSAEQQPSATDERNMPDEHMGYSIDNVEQDPIEQTAGIPDELTEPADDD